MISNAIKYSNSNTSVYFTFNITESNLIISVKDEGLGISEKDKERYSNVSIKQAIIKQLVVWDWIIFN